MEYSNGHYRKSDIRTAVALCATEAVTHSILETVVLGITEAGITQAAG